MIGPKANTVIFDGKFYIYFCESQLKTDTFGFHSHPIGVLVKARKKSGWHGSLTLPLDRGDKKERQTNRIQAQCTRTALQSHSAASGL